VRLDAGEGQWSLYWTMRGQPVPCRLVPVLVGWADLDRRETAADTGARHPILIDPDFRIDPVLARFLARSRFAWLAEGTREACARDYRLFFSFLWQRGSECSGNAAGTGAGTGRGGRPDRRHRRGRARQGAAAPHRHHTAR